jgi:hypothetical protein
MKRYEEESRMRAIAAAVVFALAAVVTTACQDGSHREAVTVTSPSPVAGHDNGAGRDNGVSSLPAEDIAIRARRAIHNGPMHVRGFVSDGSSQVTKLDVNFERPGPRSLHG